MSVFFRRPVLLLACGVMVSVALLAACGDDDDDDGGNDSGDDGSGAATVDVTLSEFVVGPDPASVAAGEVTFNAINEGEETHELVLVKTDLAPDGLPTIADGSVDEEGEGVEVVDEVEDLAAGDSQEFTVTLDAGKYVLFCNIVEEGDVHYAEGMNAAFTVE